MITMHMGYCLGPTCFSGDSARYPEEWIKARGWPKGHPGSDMNFT
jgi:hypothetical protein